MNGPSTLECDTSEQGDPLAVVPETEVTSEAADMEPLASVPARRLFYGWYMLALAMGAAIASSPGQTFGISIFNEPLRLELGLSHGQLGFAYTLGTVLGAIPIIWIGYQMDRFGLRKTLLAILFLFSIACWSLSIVQTWWQVVLSFTFLRMLGPGALSMLSGNVLPFWFSERLGAVEGFRQTAMALAMAVVPTVNLWLVVNFGWRSAYSIMGALILGLMLPVYWRFFRNAPGEVGQEVDGVCPVEIDLSPSRRDPNAATTGVESTTVAGDVLPDGSTLSLRSQRSTVSLENQLSFRNACLSPAFLLLLAGTSLFGLIHTGVFFYLVPIFAEQGLSERDAATLLVVFAISLASHQLAGGWLADILEPRAQLFIGMFLFGIGAGAVWSCTSITWIIWAGVILGAAQGLYFAAAQPLWSRYFGKHHLGKLRGVQMAVNVALSSVGPLLVGGCRDIWGGFGPVLLLFCLLPIPFAFSALGIRKPV